MLIASEYQKINSLPIRLGQTDCVCTYFFFLIFFIAIKERSFLIIIIIKARFCNKMKDNLLMDYLIMYIKRGCRYQEIDGPSSLKTVMPCPSTQAHTIEFLKRVGKKFKRNFGTKFWPNPRNQKLQRQTIQIMINDFTVLGRI